MNAGVRRARAFEVRGEGVRVCVVEGEALCRWWWRRRSGREGVKGTLILMGDREV